MSLYSWSWVSGKRRGRKWTMHVKCINTVKFTCWALSLYEVLLTIFTVLLQLFPCLMLLLPQQFNSHSKSCFPHGRTANSFTRHTLKCECDQNWPQIIKNYKLLGTVFHFLYFCIQHWHNWPVYHCDKFKHKWQWNKI